MTRFLNGGPMGVVVPHVDTPEEAEAIFAACKYPPAGCCSMYGVLPQLGFVALPAEEAIEFFNETIMVPYTAIPPPLSPLAPKGSARLSAPFRRTRLAGGLMPPRSSPVH